MLRRKLLYDLHRERETTLSRHARQSANTLSRLTREVDKHPLPYRIDYSYPYHLIVYCNGAISIHTSGFDNRMDVLRLKQSGNPCNTKYERGIMTPKGVVNYILRKWGKPCLPD